MADRDRQQVRVLHDDRTAESLDAVWPTGTPAQRASIEAVAMNMGDPSVQSVSTPRPHGDATSVFDTVRSVTRLRTTVAKVRRIEHRLRARPTRG